MKVHIASALVGAIVLGAVALFGCTPAWAAGFDGSQDLLCAPTDIAQCDLGARCERESASQVGLPSFLRIQFGKKRLISMTTPERTTAIENVRKLEGATILQGAENGRAWSLFVDQQSGLVTGSVVDAEGVFAVFGACTPVP
jgi:hypothetical protein